MRRVGAAPDARLGAAIRAPTRSTSQRPPTAASVASAANGRYIRRSAPTSLTIGMMLDVGASVRKNAAARNPIRGQRTSATPAATTAHDDQRLRHDVADRKRAGQSVVENQRVRPDAQPQIHDDHLSLIEQIGPGADRGNSPTVERGCCQRNAASTIHVAASPA